MKRIALFFLASLFCLPALAAPPIWESGFGPPLTTLTGEDDEQESVSLSFAFPFNGNNYTTVWVGTNGGLQLGGLGDDGDIDYDHWQYMDEFLSDNAPSIAGLNTDLDLSTTGKIHFRDFGDRAVFTWNEVGTNENETALITFQIQLYRNGTIILAYNGVLDDSSEDLIDDLDSGIVVGISAGKEVIGTEPGPSDLSTPLVINSTEIYDRWCYETADSCGYDGSDKGWSGLRNTAFDLDQKNVVYVPYAGGFAVNDGWALASTPPIWESNFGAEITALTGEDDDEDSVSLSFSFPFDGSTYTTIWVGTNGGLQLGSRGDDSEIDYDHWQYMDEFLSDSVPSIAGLNTDLDLSTTGTIHFNDFGDRAVFTWNEVGTDENETALITFQIQLFDSGKIILGYNGVLDGPSEDLLDDLGEGIVLGITAGNEAAGTEPGPTDLSETATSFIVNSTEIYDRWCYDTADSCGYDGSDKGWPGPINTAFDLDKKNVVFTPSSESGYDVSNGLSDIAFFRVFKDFEPDNSMEVEVFISCNDGLPLQSSQVIKENFNGVEFIVEHFTPGNLDCEITEVPVPDGYSDSYVAAVVAGTAGSIGNSNGCQFENVVGGEFRCVITNTAQDATYEVNKVWDVIGEGGNWIVQEMNLTIFCSEEIKTASPAPDTRPGWFNGLSVVKWSALAGNMTATVTVDTATGSARCWARENVFSDAVEVDNPCVEKQELTMGQTSSCTIYNTVFFEGIPTLNQYGLALLALLMLGIGAVGLRRIG